MKKLAISAVIDRQRDRKNSGTAEEVSGQSQAVSFIAYISPSPCRLYRQSRERRMGCANIKMQSVQVLPEEDDGGVLEGLPEKAKDCCGGCGKGLKKCLACLICI